MSSPVIEMQYAKPEPMNQAQPSIDGASALESVSAHYSREDVHVVLTDTHHSSSPRRRSPSVPFWECGVVASFVSGFTSSLHEGSLLTPRYLSGLVRLLHLLRVHGGLLQCRG